MIRPWKKLRSTLIGDFRIFKLRSDVSLSPRTGKEHDFFVLDSVNWVNVIALTPGQKLVMIEQFRHGSNTVELEIPGGMMDAGETDPVTTAVRELREETGYAGENARLLGKIWSNPAILSNQTYTVLIDNCRLKHEVDWDHGEDLATRLVPVSEIPRLVADEKIGHSLVVVALYHFDLWQRGIKKPRFPRKRRPTGPDALVMSEEILRYTDLAAAIQFAKANDLTTREIVRELTRGMVYSDALKYAKRAAPLPDITVMEFMRLRKNE